MTLVTRPALLGRCFLCGLEENVRSWRDLDLDHNIIKVWAGKNCEGKKGPA